ncbi:hypothetical protein Pla8534_36430 [Lignipirellula cremea]|uniref:Uncharacterized protein n=1 Tax=Lignipirellula cremea TaxID=2528010 RepID=A0A518DVG2_9BACT|nr:hypothetical protein Pla8534_36430 [Lignipirellula cremea]
MRLSGVRPLRLHLVMLHQVLIALAEFTIFGKVVDGRAEAVAAMPSRRAAEPPHGLLKTAADGLKRLRETDGRELPIGIREREVIQHVVEPLPADGDAQRIHDGEIRRRQAARLVHLRKDDAAIGSMLCSPLSHAPLKRSPLRIGEAARFALLQPGEERERPEPRFAFQSRLDFGPNLAERVPARPPLAGRLGSWQARIVAILAGRFLIHVCPPCRRGQANTVRQQPPQFPRPSLQNHRNLHGDRRLQF